MLDFFDLIIPNIKAGITLIYETGKKIPLMKNETKRERKWAGANAILNFEFSVWCKLVTVIMKGFFRIVVPECCLLKLLWVPDQLHVCSSVGNHPLATKGKWEFRNYSIRQQRWNKHQCEGWKRLSYPLIVPIWVIPRCVELSRSITGVWSVGKRRTITIIATWK